MPSIKKGFGQLKWDMPSAKTKQWSKDSPILKNYNTTRWEKIRQNHFSKNPFCVICESNGQQVIANVLDHIIPVSKGGEFWTSSNHQGLCKSHHNAKSAKERNV